MTDIREGTCPRCGHNEIIEGWPRDSVSAGVASTPMAVAVDRKAWAASEYFGQLAVFVCRQCGKAEWFAASPADIKIGPAYNTRLVQGPPKPDTPYR